MQRLLLFCLFLWSASLCSAQEERVFSSDEAVTTAGAALGVNSPSHPATAYWKISATMNLTAASPGTHVQMLLPLSDERQSVLARYTSTGGVNYREEADGLNLWGHWFVTDAGETPRQITYEYTVQIVDAAKALPAIVFPFKSVAPAFRPYLLPSELIQSGSPWIRQRARQLTRGKRRVDQAVWALYADTVALPSPEAQQGKSDALTVLQTGRGDRAGKTRALVALLRAAGIPARVVGGIRLGDTTRKRTTILWVEALIGNAWVPMDPTAGYFAWLPNTYLALYRNDLPLLIHTREVPVEYTFFIRQVPRSAVLTLEGQGGQMRDQKRHGLRYETEHLHAIATYVDRPVANVVLINDGTVPPEVVERILGAAQEAQVNVALLSADFESSYSREHYLQTLVANNLTLIREANLLLINTADTAGIYALLKQGELGVKLTGLRVVVASGIARSVSTVLASVLTRLLGPEEIVLLGQQSDLVKLWQIGQVSIGTGLPLVESARRSESTATVVNAETLARLGWWRRGVVELWTQAVRSMIPLAALNLILVLPLIAFFLVIIRNVIGLETFGTFSPMLLALAFLTTGLMWGFVVFFVIVGIGIGLRLVLQRLRLHLVSRVAILIAVVAVSMVGLTVLGATLGVNALLHVSIFPMVIMANTIENFTNTQLERGTGEALRLTFNTLLVATCSYIGIEQTGLKSVVLTFPEILVFVIGVEILLGRWRGLRLLEYVRFYGLARKAEPQPLGERQKVPAG